VGIVEIVGMAVATVVVAEVTGVVEATVVVEAMVLAGAMVETAEVVEVMAEVVGAVMVDEINMSK